jgi:DNA-binding IclR family transcriptional regulator
MTKELAENEQQPTGNQNNAKSPPAGSKTVDRTLGLLKLVAAAPPEGMRLMDLAEQSGLDRSTVYRLISTLVRHNYVDQDTMNKRYTLGLEFFALAAAASNRHDLSDRARQSLEALAEATGDTATYCLRSGAELICIDVETGSFPVKTMPMDIGSRRPIGAGATGVAILAALPDYEVEAILERSAARLTRKPGQTLELIRSRVAECRTNGFILAEDEPEGHIFGLAMALTARNGRPIGTLSLSGIPDRFENDRIAGLAALMREQARMLAEDVRQLREKRSNPWNSQKDSVSGY